MVNNAPTRICVVPRLRGVGGMVSFHSRLTGQLLSRGFQVTEGLDSLQHEAILVIGGTRNIISLWRARRRGIPIFQRLDGMNWVHRVRKTGFRHFLRSEYGNWLLNFIRTRLVDGVIYQSQFVQQWWERVQGKTGVDNTVIYNGVDLDIFTPVGPQHPPEDRYRILMVEGSLMGGYELGLEHAIELVNHLRGQVNRPIELMVVGRVDPASIEHWHVKTSAAVKWLGSVPLKQIPGINRSAHVLFSADLNPACPNTVIEALACGLPVVAFDTGALSEIVNEAAGHLVPYGGDPWRLDPPDIPRLAQATLLILQNQGKFRLGARTCAETRFDLEVMVDQYLKVLLD